MTPFDEDEVVVEESRNEAICRVLGYWSRLDYVRKLQFYSLVSLLFDFFNISLTAYSIHLLSSNSRDLTVATQWIISFVYVIPLVGIVIQRPIPMVIYTITSLLYMSYTFYVTTRLTLQFHSIALLSPMESSVVDFVWVASLLLKMLTCAPLFRFTFYCRDRFHFDVYIKKREKQREQSMRAMEVARREAQQRQKRLQENWRNPLVESEEEYVRDLLRRMNPQRPPRMNELIIRMLEERAEVDNSIPNVSRRTRFHSTHDSDENIHELLYFPPDPINLKIPFPSHRR
ncbi:hypothetical protein M3Y98_00718000 [Aphelenchoides besseyi]|nr:hypothetical protein M3Y98_00718000 [Aphelenchoides besseyi]KAI6210265.1 hypothetical protein M3Y96_00309800 [Aphelenchoides besseyi]